MNFDEHLEAVEGWAGTPLSDGYRAFLASHGGQFVGDLVRFYSVDELIERNECYETLEFCPGFLVIGDDSGGRAVMMSQGAIPPTVFLVDHGSMNPEDFERVSDSLLDWVGNGCPL
jgi:SMI1 / KNR4 family (SUKH-1)